MALTKGVKILLKRFLDYGTITLSWGITNIQILDNCVKFRVCGLKYQGMVEIYSNGVQYKVKMGGQTHFSNHENLIHLLDNKIERTENYASDILEILVDR